MNLKRNFIIMFVSAGLFGRLTAARASNPGYWSWAQTPPMGWNSWDGFATTVKVKDGYKTSASEAPKDENQQHVATCCRCVAGRKAQQNPCKIRLVAVLPIKKR
jgi:hypothetical protein